MATRREPHQPPSDRTTDETMFPPEEECGPARADLSSDDSAQRSADGGPQRKTLTVDANPSARRIAGAFSQQLIFRIAGMLASIFTLSITVRHLGGTTYGQLTAAILFISLWTSLTELGIGAVIVRRVTGAGADLGHLVRLNTGLSLVYCIPLTAAAVGSGIVIYSLQDTPEVVQLIPIVAIGLTLTTISSCLNPVFLATVRFTSVAVSDVLGRVLSLGLTLVLVRAEAGLLWFAVVQLVPPVIVLVVQGFAASRLIDWRPIFDLRESWDLIRESLPQTGVLIIGVLYWRLDGVLLSLVGTAESTATYYVAYTFAFTLSVVTTFFGASTLSTMTRLFAEDAHAFAEFIKRSVESMLFVGLPIAVVGTVLATPIIRALSSEELTDQAGITLALLFVAVGITFINSVSSQALFASHQQVFLLRLNVISLVINIGLNLALIPAMGAAGAALALIVTELIGLVVTTIRLSQLSGYRTPWVFLGRLSIPVIAAGAVAEVLHVGSMTFIPAFVAAVVVYLGVNIVLGPVRVSTVRELLRREDG